MRIPLFAAIALLAAAPPIAATDFHVAVEPPTRVLEYGSVLHLNATAWASCADVARDFDAEGASGIQFGVTGPDGQIGGAGDAVPFSAQRNCNPASIAEAAGCPPDVSLPACAQGYPWARADGQVHVFAFADAPADVPIPGGGTVVGHQGQGPFNVTVAGYAKWVTSAAPPPIVVATVRTEFTVAVVLHANAPVEFKASASAAVGDLEVERTFSIPSPLANGTSRIEVPVRLTFTAPAVAWTNTTGDLLVTARTANMEFPVIVTVPLVLERADFGGPATPTTDAEGESTPVVGPGPMLALALLAAALGRRRR